MATQLRTAAASGGVRAASGEAWFTAVTVLTGTALWLITRPYLGVIHDSRLYTLMAMAWAEPQRFGSDLFLAYGSQDAFSVFSPLYGFLFAHLGLSVAYPLLLLVGGAIWLAGSWALLHALLDGRAAKYALLLQVTLPLHYGAWGALVLGENFVTARLFAEGFVLLGLAAALRGRLAAACLALLVAGALHPLSAMPGIAVAVLVAIRDPRTRLWAVLGLGSAAVLAAVALGLAGVKPFDGLLHRMDATWLGEVRARNGFVFMADWYMFDWGNVGGQAAAIAGAAIWATGRVRMCLLAMLGVASAGLLLSLIGGDWMKDVFVIQLQAWRFAWLLAWAAPPSIVLLARCAMWRQEVRYGTLLLALTMLIVPSVVTLAFGAFGVALLLVRRKSPDGLRLFGGAMVLIAALLVLATLSLDVYLLGRDCRQLSSLGLPTLSVVLTSLPGRLLLIGLGATVLSQAGPRAVLAVAISLLLLGGAVTAWDQRDAWMRYAMAGDGPALPGHGAVQWGNDATDTWLLLRRPAYVSAIQSAGLLFSRPAGTEWVRRLAVARKIVFEGVWKPRVPPPDCALLSPVLTAADVRTMCRGGGLDGVILERPLPDVASVAFRTPVAEVQMCMRNKRLAAHRNDAFHYVPCPAGTGHAGVPVSP